MAQKPDDIIFSAILSGGIYVLLVNLFPHTETIAIGVGVFMAWLTLIEGGINDYFGFVTSIIYILTAWSQLRVGWIPGEYYYVELISMLALGVFGLGLVILRQLFGQVIANISAFPLLSIAWQIRKLVSIRSFITISIVPAILVNVGVRIISPPFLSEVITTFTSISAFALISWASFYVKSVLGIVNYIRQI